MKVYLAGAMACYGSKSNEAKEWCEEVKKYFRKYSEFSKIISPVDYYSIGGDNSKKPSEIMRFDLRKVKESNLVLVNLKDLDESLGTSDEILYAYMNEIPIIGFLQKENGLEELEVMNIIHPWKYEQIDRIETGKDAMTKAMDYIIEFYDE